MGHGQRLKPTKKKQHAGFPRPSRAEGFQQPIRRIGTQNGRAVYDQPVPYIPATQPRISYDVAGNARVSLSRGSQGRPNRDQKRAQQRAR